MSIVHYATIGVSMHGKVHLISATKKLNVTFFGCMDTINVVICVLLVINLYDPY